MAEAVCQRIREQRTRQEEPVEEISSSSKFEEDPVPDSSSNLEGEYVGTTTPSQLVAHLSLRSARNTMGTRGTPE